MLRHTQTITGLHGNCWQTAVACVLEVDPAAMPPQEKYDLRTPRPDGTIEYGPSYNNALQGYLRVHHGLAYVELHVPAEAYGFLALADDRFHIMTGRTVRSAALGGLRHVVVGQRGKCVWDPHPSRAGLLDEVSWAFLVPYPKRWERPNPLPCLCPACAPTGATAAGAGAG